MRAASKYASPNEMSEAVLGQLSPAECAVRVRDLLSSKTVLDEVQERRLLLFQMAEHLDFLRSQRENPKTWAHLSRMYKVLSDQIERANVNVSDVSTKLAESHAAYFTEGFVLGFRKIIESLLERDIIEAEVDDSEMLELVESGVGESSAYLKKVTAREVDDE